MFVLAVAGFVWFACAPVAIETPARPTAAGTTRAVPLPAEIEASIVRGLGWLVPLQNANGSWGTSELVAHTGFVLLKLEDRAR